MQVRVHVALPTPRTQLRLLYDPEDRPSDKEYFAFCEANPDLRVERTAEGEIMVVPPAGMESDYRNN